MRWTPTIAILVVAVAGVWSTASGMDDRPVIDSDVRAVTHGGMVRVLVELRSPSVRSLRPQRTPRTLSCAA